MIAHFIAGVSVVFPIITNDLAMHSSQHIFYYLMQSSFFHSLLGQ